MQRRKIFVLAWRPRHIAATDDMDVKMEYTLRCGGSIIDNDAIPIVIFLCESLKLGHLRGRY
jgi:hypothetical protein